MVIMLNALKERMRRKELYIVVAIGVLILGLFGGGAGTISINGIPVTDYKNMFGIIHIVVNATSCILAVILSINTIPKEYERNTSHLVWIRGISQRRYHLELALANICSAVIASLILYLSLAIYMISKGEVSSIIYLFPAFIIVCINISIISLLTSVLSIKLPSAVTGFIATVCCFVGLAYGLLDIYRNIVGGVTANLLKGLLFIVPDLNGIGAEASNIILGRGININIILQGLLAIYVISWGIILFKKKEA